MESPSPSDHLAAASTSLEVGAHAFGRRGRAVASGTARRLQGLDDLEEEPTVVEALEKTASDPPPPPIYHSKVGDFSVQFVASSLFLLRFENL